MRGQLYVQGAAPSECADSLVRAQISEASAQIDRKVSAERSCRRDFGNKFVGLTVGIKVAVDRVARSEVGALPARPDTSSGSPRCSG